MSAFEVEAPETAYERAYGGGAGSLAEPETSRRSRERAGSQANGRHWLIVRGLPHEEEVFTTDGKPAVFSFREEAEVFFGARGPDDEWRIEEFWAAELVCRLHGTLSGFKYLALDPLPEIRNREMDSLVSVSREGFIEMLSRRRRPLSRRPVED